MQLNHDEQLSASPAPEEQNQSESNPQAAPAPEPATASPPHFESAAAAAPALEPAETATPATTAPEVGSADTSTAVQSAASAEAGGEESAVSEQEMNQLIDQYSVPQETPSEGEMVEGRVVAVTDLGVVVDIGAKTEGLIPAQEFTDAAVEIKFESGQPIEVQRTSEHKDGYIVLSHIRARRKRAWENIEKSYRAKSAMTGKIVDRIKGGLVVDVGVRAFLPASQLDLRPVRDLDGWKDKEIEVRVIKMNRKRGNVVVSRRVILEEEQKAVREKLMSTFSEGMTVTGAVKNITDYGVFVDLGGLDGLLHITDLTWGRISHPSEVVSPGQQIEAQILRFDREKMRVSLGRKQLLPDPWGNVPERFPAGTRAKGRVVGITDYGAFIEIEPGVEGLVHVSEMSWSKRMKHPSKVVKISEEVEVVVLEMKPEQRRISLGLKQTQPDPWQALTSKYPVGTIITGRVRNLTDFGAFVEIEEGIDGLIHVSDLSWAQRVKHPGEVVKKGETVQAKVLKIDAENHRLSLGIKQVNDIWGGWYTSHRVNEVIRGRVSRLTTFGAFVDLGNGIEGLCHISEIEDRKSKGDRQQQGKGLPSISLDVGQEYDFKIIKMNPNDHKIGLSYRAAQKQVERKEMDSYHRSSKSSATATIGDAIMAKRESAR